MQPDQASKPFARWAGLALSGLVTLALSASAAGKLTAQPPVVDMLVNHLGFGANSLTAIGLVELVSAVLFIVPATGPIGAVLLTGYLGGAVCAHVRLGEPFLSPLVIGALAWVGLVLRDPSVLKAIPLFGGRDE
jgi:hypothetical protein